ncbi:hypothetical protein NKG05_15855 [Oerskovia sp. M15]
MTAAVRAGNGTDGVHLAHDGRAQWLVGLYRREALDGAVARLAGDTPVGRPGSAGRQGLHGAPVRRLVSGLSLQEVEDVDGLSTDVDTWQDAESYAQRRAQEGTARQDLHGSSGGTA